MFCLDNDNEIVLDREHVTCCDECEAIFSRNKQHSLRANDALIREHSAVKMINSRLDTCKSKTNGQLTQRLVAIALYSGNNEASPDIHELKY